MQCVTGITFTGVIVWFTGLHIGTINDNDILNANPPPMLPWEWGLADGAFKDCDHILVKFIQPDGGLLTVAEVIWNSIFNYWRVRVEHIIGDVKNHDMFVVPFRGSYALLQCCVRMTVHLTNIKLKMALPRYDTMGPWGHQPGSAPAAAFDMI